MLRTNVPLLETGAVMISGRRKMVTAGNFTLSAWASTDGVRWNEVARRAGGAALFPSALALRASACAWLRELYRTGRM